MLNYRNHYQFRRREHSLSRGANLPRPIILLLSYSLSVRRLSRRTLYNIYIKYLKTQIKSFGGSVLISLLVILLRVSGLKNVTLHFYTYDCPRQRIVRTTLYNIYINKLKKGPMARMIYILTMYSIFSDPHARYIKIQSLQLSRLLHSRHNNKHSQLRYWRNCKLTNLPPDPLRQWPPTIWILYYIYIKKIKTSRFLYTQLLEYIKIYFRSDLCLGRAVSNQGVRHRRHIIP